MRLLVITQKIDKNDTVLGFFHGWVVELSKKVESIEVICLEKGSYDLPKNVTVYSLGKEKGVSKIGYVYNFYKYLNLISGSYDKVFVHMNQEYILLAGLYWKIKNIPVYFWRNHPRGNIFTYISVMLSKKVFCASNLSYTAKFKKTIIMPAGIDTNVFSMRSGLIRKKYSVCMVGRISPIKHVELAIEAVNMLVSSGVQVTLDIIGPVPQIDQNYFESLKKYVTANDLGKTVHFEGAISPEKIPEYYNSFEICLNLTESGSFDKTIVESAGCGAIPLVSNKSFESILPRKCLTTQNPKDIAESIKILLEPHNQVELQNDLKDFVKKQSLSVLMDKLLIEIK